MRLISQSVEFQNDVDCVFQKLRAGGGFCFCHLSDNDQYEVSLLGEAAQDITAFSNLSSASGECVRRTGVHRLNGVDDQQLQLCLIDVSENGVYVCLEEEKYVL